MKSPWIEAMRPHTLPVSCAGVFAGTAVALLLRSFQWLPALICLLFALLAQTASNFANEYFDFRKGLDSKGREGFRRGVTEGDISPKAMLTATLITLAAACAIGCTLIHWGGITMIPVGILIAIFAMAYSAGPYPLSHHGLGEIAVFLFFGLVPVTLTAWLQCPGPHTVFSAMPIAGGVGMIASNVLIVNNVRDMEDDCKAGKKTTAVIFGKRVMSTVYLINVLAGIPLILLTSTALLHYTPLRWMAVGATICGCILGVQIWRAMRSLQGRDLNDILKLTAMLLLIMSMILLLMSALDTLF